MTHAPNRRGFLLASAGLLAAAAAPAALAADPYANSPFRKLTEADWKKRLPPESFQVLRHEATEFAGSSPLLKEHRKGTFVCLGCGLPLFRSEWKFESGTGWPSFYTAIKGAIAKKTDFKSASLALSITAPSAWGTRATCSTMGRSPPACATATTAWR